MFKNTTCTLKNILKIFVFVGIVFVFVILLSKTADSQLIKRVKDFTKDGTKVLYITNQDSYKKFPIDILRKYDIKYIYINSDTLNRFEKTKLKDIINSEYLTNIVVVFKDGKVSDALIHYENDDSLISFLQAEEVIPKVIEDITGIIDSVSEALESDYSIVYIPYEYSEDIYIQSEILKKISKQYLIDFKIIKAYLLSNEQKEKINSKLNISSVEDQITIMIKNKTMVGNIRGIKKYSTYLKEFLSSKFIDQKDYINYITIKEFKKILKLNKKSIVVVGSNNCKYCDELRETLNEISATYDVTINYLNIKSTDSTLAEQTKQILDNLNFNEGFTTPLTLLLESNKILDYVVGASNMDYFVEKFVENGIIKQEVSQ